MNGLLSPDDMMLAGAQGTPSVDENALMQSLYGMGDYAGAGMFLPYAITPQGKRVLSFPAPIQSVARSVARGMGAMPLETDPYTGMLSENVLADAAEAAGLFTGAGLLAPKPAGALGMSGGGGGVTRTIPPRQVDDLGFYSQALETAARLPQVRGTGQQMEAMLTKAGVKPDEIAFTPGLRGLLDQPQVTREELVGLLQEKQIRPQETVLEGGDPEFEGMNFPDRPEVLDVYKAFGSDYVNEQADELLFYNTEYLLDAIGDIPKRTQYGEIPDTKEKITQALLDGNIDELDTNTEIFLRQKAEQLAIDQYDYDPVLRLQDPDTGYEIVGSDEMGYTIKDDGGNPIDPQGNDIPYSLSEARIQAENHAMDAGLVGFGGGETRFSEYTEPSGTNYREILLQVPEYEGMRGEFVQRGHFDEPNIAVHARTKDRATESGSNDVLYVEELQSDWAQQGRDKGFATKESIDKKQELDTTITPLMDEQMRLSKERDKLIESYGAKIADKEAAKSPLNDEGMYYSRYGSVYRLEPDESSVLVLPRNQVEELLQLGMDQAYPFRPGKETDWEIEARPKYNELSSKIKDLSSQIKPIKDELTKLPSGPQKGPLVGNTEKFAEAGIKRLLIQAANEGKRYVSFSPGDLQADRWNNPGLEVYYDEIIPKVAKKVAKRFDKEAFTGNKYIEELGDRFTIEITPKMRASIQEGVPLFVTGGQGLLAAGEGMRQQPQQGILY